MKDIVYIDRATGNKVIEKLSGKTFLNFLYTNPFGKLTLNALVRRKFVSVLGGWYMNSKKSICKVKPFIDKNNIDINEYIVPKKGFSTFNDFFCRKIKPSARPIQDGVVSPVDGKILVFPKMEDIDVFFVKGIPFSLSSFIKDSKLINNYKKGAMAIIRLAPFDYHRFHFPESGIISTITKIKGTYFSISPLALRKSLRILCENKREYSILHTEKAGNILIMDIGATMVGSIVQTFTKGMAVSKGDEKGYFSFGGSTIVLLFEKKSIVFEKDLINNTRKGFETSIKMGEKIGQ